MSLVDLVRTNPVFAGSDRAALRDLVAGAELVEAPEKMLLVRRDAPVEALHVLLEGTVRVFHENDDGREVTVKLLSPPCTFSEMEILAREPTNLESAAALTACRIVRIPAPNLTAFLAREPRAAVLLLEDVCRRFCVAARNEVAPFFEAEPRIASFLLAYADLFGSQRPEGLRITRAVTQQEIADGLGITIRSVARTLAAWKASGLVTRRKGWLVLHRPAELEEICRGLRYNLTYRFPNGTS